MTGMEGLTACGLIPRLPRHFYTNLSKSRPSFRRRPGPFLVIAASDRPELNKWDLMELKFGKLLGEDPKLTLAKIMAKKDDPHVSYLEVEKSFRKNKGKLDNVMLNVPEDVLQELEISSPQTQKSQDLPRQSKLNLSRPMISKVNKSNMLEEKPFFVEAQNEQLPGNVIKDGNVLQELEISSPQTLKSQDLPRQSKLNLSRPIISKVNKSKILEEKSFFVEAQNEQLTGNVMKETPSNISLRKPSVFNDKDIEADTLKFNIMPNLYFKTTTNPTQSSSEVTLLKKPEAIQVCPEPFEESVARDDSYDISSKSFFAMDNVDTLHKVEPENVIQQSSFRRIANYDTMAARDGESEGISDGLQPPMQRGIQQIDAKLSSTSLLENSISNKNEVSLNASLLEKPSRQEDSGSLHPGGSEASNSNYTSYNNSADAMKVQSAEEVGCEEDDWTRAENLLKQGERAHVELISSSSRGFMVSFGSLIGFLPYRNLGTKWKYIAFESWLRKKGLNPSSHRHNLSVVGTCDDQSENRALFSSQNLKNDKELSWLDMKFGELLEAYEQEKTKYLSSFVGQKLRVSVVRADKSSRRLLFSGRPNDNEELIEKKRRLMERLNVGDFVKCCIKKITYFGIFVEVDGVPALIHQSEISWDTTLEPSTYFKIGQVVEAKVYQLDFALERITLSLKEMAPDPLVESLETVVDGGTSLGENMESAQAELEWADVDTLVKELQMVDGVNNVTKGRLFLSPGLAPNFQVYMASVLDNQYKLLARSENKVQEILVQASLDKEELKNAILRCTNVVQ